MSYAQKEDLAARIGSIYSALYGTRESDADEDLESAAAEIDGALAARYRLPVTGTRSLALLRDWNLTLAEERAYARCAGNGFSEKVKQRVEQVRRYLEMVRMDEFRLPDAAEHAASDTNAGIAFLQNEKPVFSRDKMRKF